MAQYTAVLDIGSSKVMCLIASMDGRDGMVVRGAGMREYSGYENGKLSDPQQLSEAISDAVALAEGEARRRVRIISVGVPASFTKLVLHGGEVVPRAKNRRISHRDIDELINVSLDFRPPEGYELIHSTPVDFTVDGTPRAEMPIGMQAEKLSGTVSHVYVEENFKQVISKALLRIGLDVDMFIAVPLSEGLFVIPEALRAKPAILVDVGAKNTDVSVMRNAALVANRTIPVGGAHFSGDLGYGLGVQGAVAETVKRRYVYSLEYQDSIDIIRLPGGETMRVEHEAIRFIVEARTRELASLIADAAKEMGVLFSEKPALYLTGGGITLMRGSCEFMEKCLGLPVEVRMPTMPRLSTPNYASAFSVMEFVMNATDDGVPDDTKGAAPNGKLINKLKNLFVN
ncbi:MAG: hypothetical protein E7330_05755 [Clostridiales bacterium]|nr:hypothetical protein [Clostridiales bacterium]